MSDWSVNGKEGTQQKVYLNILTHFMPFVSLFIYIPPESFLNFPGGMELQYFNEHSFIVDAFYCQVFQTLWNLFLKILDQPNSYCWSLVFLCFQGVHKEPWYFQGYVKRAVTWNWSISAFNTAWKVFVFGAFLVWMQENVDHRNTKDWHFLRRVIKN